MKVRTSNIIMLQDWDAMQVEKARKKEARAVAKAAQKEKEKERAAFLEVGRCRGRVALPLFTHVRSSLLWVKVYGAQKCVHVELQTPRFMAAGHPCRPTLEFPSRAIRIKRRHQALCTR